MSEGLKMKYFVLNPTKKDYYGLASRMAILAYAAIMSKHNPKLTKDLRAWIEEIGLDKFDHALQDEEREKHLGTSG